MTQKGLGRKRTCATAAGTPNRSPIDVRMPALTMLITAATSKPIICDLVAVVSIKEVVVTHGQQNQILREQRIASETTVQH